MIFRFLADRFPQKPAPAARGYAADSLPTRGGGRTSGQTSPRETRGLLRRSGSSCKQTTPEASHPLRQMKPPSPDAAAGGKRPLPSRPPRSPPAARAALRTRRPAGRSARGPGSSAAARSQRRGGSPPRPGAAPGTALRCGTTRDPRGEDGTGTGTCPRTPPRLTSPAAAAAALSGGAAAPSPGGGAAAAAAPARPPSLRRRRPPPQPHHPAGSGGRQPLADGGRGGDGAGAASGRGRRRRGRAPACRCPPVFAALWPAALQAVGGRRLPACYREPRRRGLGALERLLPTGASPVGFGFRGLRARLHPGVPSLTSPRPPGCRPYDTRMAPWPASARDRWKGRSEMSARVVGTHPSCVRNSRRWLAAYFLEGVRKIIHNPHRDQLKGEAGVSCFSN